MTFNPPVRTIVNTTPPTWPFPTSSSDWEADYRLRLLEAATIWLWANSGGVTPPVLITGTNPATIPLTVQGAASQSVDYFLVEDNPTGNRLFEVDAGGNINIANSEYRITSGSGFVLNGSGSVSQPFIQSKLSADTPNYRFTVNTDGTILWGIGGSSAPDVSIHRSAVGVLTIDNGSGGNGGLVLTGTGQLKAAGLTSTAITSGALPTQTFTSGTAVRNNTGHDVVIHFAWTGDVAAATLLVEMSPDNVTFSTLFTLQLPAGSTTTTMPVTVKWIAGWRIRVTLTNGSVSVGTYY